MRDIRSSVLEVLRPLSLESVVLLSDLAASTGYAEHELSRWLVENKFVVGVMLLMLENDRAIRKITEK